MFGFGKEKLKPMESTFIHRDFKLREGDWNVNKMYMDERTSGTLPNHFYRFSFTEEILTDFLEDCHFPTEIKVTSPGTYEGMVFTEATEEDPNIEEWIHHGHATILETPKEVEEAKAS